MDGWIDRWMEVWLTVQAVLHSLLIKCMDWSMWARLGVGVRAHAGHGAEE
jgi:hypothetical protein